MEYTKKEAKAYARAKMHGLWGAITYPFKEDLELDAKGLVSDLAYYIDTLKIDGYYMGGIINEFWALTVEERMRAQEILIREANKKVVTISMTGHTCIKTAIELSRHAQKAGADFVALMNPYYAARTPEIQFEYFRAIASEVDAGILILNSPTAGYLLSPQQVAQLAEIDNICGIKNDTTMEHSNEIRRLVGDQIVVSDPNEDNWLINCSFHQQQVFLASPSPHLLQWKDHLTIVAYTQAAMKGDLETAKRISAGLDPLRRVAKKWIWQPWAAGYLPLARLKYWQKLLGLAGGYVRPPLIEMTETEKRDFRKDLEAAGLPIHA